MMLRTARGFSLIELMITIAIVAILVMVAYPTYTESVRKSRRADAKITLESYAALQERWFAQNNSYTDDIDKLGGATSPDGYYTIELCDAPPPSPCAAMSGGAPFTRFDLRATAIGKQSDDRCTTFTLDEIGARGYTGALGSKDHCW